MKLNNRIFYFTIAATIGHFLVISARKMYGGIMDWRTWARDEKYKRSHCQLIFKKKFPLVLQEYPISD
jgi:hypothetical protein